MGRIVARQNEQLKRGARGIVGNHVIIKHGAEFSVYAHLKPGSVVVKPDDMVTRGQQIAAVGSSGSSTEPHLHFQVCDAPDPLLRTWRSTARCRSGSCRAAIWCGTRKSDEVPARFG